MNQKSFMIRLLAAFSLAACTSRTLTPPVEQPQGGEVTPAYPGPGEGEGQQPLPYPPPGEVEPIPFTPYPGIEQPEGQTPMYIPAGPSEYAAQPEDTQLTRSEVMVDLARSEILVLESYPLQAVAILRGDLPNPCHKLRVVLNPLDSQNNLYLEVYAVTAPDQVCTAVIEPFDVSISLGSFAGGMYKVLVNGQELGQIDS